jgi:hypothetical protein
LTPVMARYVGTWISSWGVRMAGSSAWPPSSRSA